MNSKAKQLLNKILNYKYNSWGQINVSKHPDYKEFEKEVKEEIKPLALELVDMMETTSIECAQAENDDVDYKKINDKRDRLRKVSGVLRTILSKNQKYTDTEWIELMQRIHEAIKKLTNQYNYSFLKFGSFPLSSLSKQIIEFYKKNDLTDELKDYIRQLLQSEEFVDYSDSYSGPDVGKFSTKLLDMLSKEDDFRYTFAHHELKVFNERLKTFKAYDQPALHRLLFLMDSASAAKPSEKFQREVADLLTKLDKDHFRAVVHALLEHISQLKLYQRLTQWGHEEDCFLANSTKQFAKGLAWSCTVFSDKTTISLLAKLLEKSYLKIPGIGPYAAGVGNACVYALGNMRGKDGLGTLSRMRLKIKQNNVKKLIDQYLDEGAKKYNVSVEELKEMATPDFGLKDGSKMIPFGEYQLQVSIKGSKVKQQWIKPDGSPMKSVPSIVKKDEKLTQKLKNIRKEVKEIQKVYTAQKQRIDNLFILDRVWDFESFQKYYLEHGLVSPIAQKTIWSISKGSQSTEAMPWEGSWTDVQGKTVDWIDDTCSVKLWHPVNATEAEITAWRDRIMTLECKQPIKQAFREIYLVTDAELNTVNYSNRMAAHILKQHQFSTLAKLRDWKYSLMGAYDDGKDHETCYRVLPEHNITAEFWIDELADFDNDAFNDAGIWHYITTDQVKFKKGQKEIIDMKDVPKLVFSEIMRDVDLFVGVASVGNDPEWQDNDGQRRHVTYWQSYSFGDLTELAKTRKAILERLLPKLKKLKGKASIEGKFLKVEGTIRNYKIHIGSGNILMEPDDQYLCIVPDRNPEKKTDKLFIPFEGDKTLSIVLSKAFLLAEDDKITDTTITSQINRR